MRNTYIQECWSENFNPSISKYSCALACKLEMLSKVFLHNGVFIQIEISNDVPVRHQDFQVCSFYIGLGTQRLSKYFHNQLGVSSATCIRTVIYEKQKKLAMVGSKIKK